MENRLIIGDLVKADIIGLGFYKVVSIDDFHITFKCIRMFDGKNPEYAGHETNINCGVDKDNNKIPVNHLDWYRKKVTKKLLL